MDKNVKRIYNIINAAEHNASAGKRRYLIKGYQRGYRWEIDQVYNLHNDIYINYKKYAKELKKVEETEETGYEYCLQPLVLHRERNREEEGVETYAVIDGQQRLTTLSLVFKALNRLQYPHYNSAEPLDEIDIEYDRAETGETLKRIDEICKAVESFDVKDMTLDNVTEEMEHNEELKKLIAEARQDLNIDGCFMVENYVYLYLYFKIIRDQKVDGESYFAFLNNEKDKITNYAVPRMEKLRTMFKRCTTVIWYEPLEGKTEDGREEEDVFEDFNARKVPLTKSELIKALFMNPDNYIKEGDKNYSNEAIKVKQIMLGVKWDSIEKALHGEELWHFIPHFDTWHEQTRFDAVIDYFVYCEYKGRNKEATERAIREKYEFDKLFAFKQLQEWMKQELAAAQSSKEKSDIMKEWWERICNTYNSFEELLEPQKSSVKIFHRISLLQMMERLYFERITNGSEIEKYFVLLERNKKFFDALEAVGNDEKLKVLNQKITELINKIFDNPKTTVFSAGNSISVKKEEKCKTLDQKIRALKYVKQPINFLIEIFLVIFSLYHLEATEGVTSRFAFHIYEKKVQVKKEGKPMRIWIQEHIFAGGTNLSKHKEEFFSSLETQHDFLDKLKNCGWEEYLDYKFTGILEEDEIAQLKERKQNLLSLLPTDRSVWADERIWDISPEAYVADTVQSFASNDYEALIAEFLKDNSIGNMALLALSENTAVGNKLYAGKKKEIMDKIAASKFVPTVTTNVFTGTYCDGSFSTEVWYPCHRKKYLESMIQGITAYLA